VSIPIASNCIPNPSFVPSEGLQNYWTFCSSLTDIVGQVTLFNGVNAEFSSDRFNISNSSISLLNGYLQAPPGVYFSGDDYTVMVWIYPRAFSSWSKIIDFGNGRSSNNIVCSLTRSTTGKPVLENFLVSKNVLSISSTQLLKLNVWQHVAFVYSNSTLAASIYVNASLFAAGKATGPMNKNVLRSSCFIGKSSWSDPNINAIIDEFKIFTVALNQSQIVFEMQNEFFIPIFDSTETTR
jgi:hypothetical protein